MPNWDFVGFAISQIGLSQIQQTISDLYQQRRRSVLKIVKNYLWSILTDISNTSPRRIIMKACTSMSSLVEIHNIEPSWGFKRAHSSITVQDSKMLVN